MDKKKKEELYLKGYEEGLKEAWSTIKSIVSRYDGWELKSRVNGKIGTLYQDISSKRVELQDDPSILVVEDDGGEEETRGRPSIEGASTILIVEKKLDEGLSVFKELLKDGDAGICISREYPQKYQGVYGLKDMDVHYVVLSKNENDSYRGDDTEWQVNNPANLSDLSTIIGNFMKDNNGGVILLTGVQYILVYNDFKLIHKLINFVKEKINQYGGKFILSVSRSSFNDSELGILETEFEKQIEM
ncbi:MAG: DUF835 domain-containing protein [Thermoplasmata archaeon]